MSARLAALLTARQVEAVARADACADAAERAVRRAWRRLLALLEGAASPADARHRAAALLRQLRADLEAETRAALARLGRWGAAETGGALARALTLPQLRAAALARLRGGRAVRESRLLEAGAVEIALRALGLRAIDLASPLREPAFAAAPEREQRDAFASLLFPPPTAEQVLGLLGGGWRQQLERSTRLADPDALAGLIAAGYALGRDRREIAADLLPALEGVRASARRIARTEGMRVAHASQEAMYRSLGPLLVGYQVHATLDQHTRPWHAARDGEVYYLRPEPGRKGMAQCPHPPEEPADPGERPVGAPQTAYHCRCFLTPVLTDADAARLEAPAFRTNAGRVVPDPATYSEWFGRADERRRRIAVGTRRYSLLRDRLGADPSWADFLDPATGDLVPLGELRRETPRRRADRVAKVRAAVAERARLARETALHGGLLGI